MTCNCDKCFEHIEDDDYEIERLQDIVTICEFLIKHKKNKKNKMSVEELMKYLDEQSSKETKKEDKKEKNKKEESDIKKETVLYNKYSTRYPYPNSTTYTYRYNPSAHDH